MREEPVFADNLPHAEIIWNSIDVDYSVYRLIPVVNTRFLVVQGNALGN
jgi:hypothetical protein